MKSITELLENIGQQSNLKYSAEVNSRKLLTELFVPEVIQQALIYHDNSVLAKFFGVKQDIVCYILGPYKDRETPKDDNKPEPEEETSPNDSALSKAS
ncbi:hypothetical protein AADZ91_10835 [Colwelliaceae bacterium 6441]